MQQRNIDGIVLKKRTQTTRGVRVVVHVVHEPAPTVPASAIRSQSRAVPVRQLWCWPQFGRLPVYAVVVLVVCAFGAGGWVTWRTDATLAEAPLAPAVSAEPVPMPLDVPSPALGQVGGLPNEALFSMTLEQVEHYLTEGYKTPEMKLAEQLLAREEKLLAYLSSKRSPLANIAATLARLKHWKLVIAISNSESSLGKRCADNNCSGIGVEPGHRLWREYESTADWAKDLDALIEKRYKNWTLEQMNGVYNNPGSENWVFAAHQVLSDLQEIE